MLEKLTQKLINTCLFELPKKISVTEKQAAAQCLIDSLACAFSAYKEPAIEILMDAYLENSPTTGSSIIGYSQLARTDDAALINGSMVSLQLFDDNQAQMRGHPSGPLLPAVLAVAEEVNASIDQALTAFVIGYELECRIGMLLNPAHYELGWHATATQGTFAATIACAHLLNLNVPQTQHALGIAASMASGVRRNFGTMTMSFHSGLAASNGVKAARLAKRGFTADTHIFDGPMNIGQVFSKEWSDTALWSDLEKWGEPFVIIHPGQTFKLYPCGRPPLFAIDCVVELQKKHQLKLNDIKKITCDVSYMYPRTLIHSRPINGLQAKTSLEYCIASALLDKRPSLVSFSDEAVKRPEIAKLIDLIEVRVPPHLSDEVESVRKAPFEQPVTLTIENKAKKIFIETTAFHKGSPENPASQSDLDQKFKDCLSPWISQARIPQILELCKNTSTPMKVLMRKLCI